MSVRQSRAAAVALVTLTAFADLVAYSIAVPVLPDLGRRLGASPTLIGLLFASFGVTVLAVSVPMGAASDRRGRKGPLVIGAVVLVGSTLVFAYADSFPWLFAARLLQGAADAVTWVVGFALIADLYGPADRGRVMGLVMAGSNFGLLIGPTMGGWLYEAGGMRLPFLVVAALGTIAALGLASLRLPASTARGVDPVVTIGAALRLPAVRSCAIAVVLAGATIAMLEPVLSLFLSYELGMPPSRIGLVFGAAAVVATLLHPIFGRMADRWGARRVTIAGLVVFGVTLPLMSQARSFETATLFYIVQAVAMAVVATPSLAFMAEAMASAGAASFGLAYGVYNFSWALGLLAGPAMGGFLYEQLGFALLTFAWAPFLVLGAVLLARTRAASFTIRRV